MSISQFSVIPNQQRPTTFSNDMDQFLSEFNPIIIQQNAVNAALSPLSDAAATIIATANYKGLWTSLTGPLNIPASVYHLGKFWTLTQNIADVTTKVPGTATEWAQPVASLGGSQTTTSATSVTIALPAFRVQSIAMTASGQNVNLPSATLMSTGSGLFVFRNAGSIPWNLRDGASGLKAVVGPGQILTLSLIDNTTAAGIWAVANDSPVGTYGRMLPGTNTTHNALSSSSPRIVLLSATKGIVTHYRGTTMYGAVATVSGLSISLGTEMTIATSVTSAVRVVGVSATQAVILTISGNVLSAQTLDVSGTTLTTGTPLSVYATAFVSSMSIDIAIVTPTKVMIAYTDNSSYSISGVIVDISGTTLTLGTAINFGTSSSSGSRVGIIVNSTTKVGIVNRKSATGNGTTNIYLATLSGSTLTGTNNLQTTANGRFVIPQGSMGCTLGNGLGVFVYTGEPTSTTAFSGTAFILLFDITGSSPVLVGQYEYGCSIRIAISVTPVGSTGFALRSTNLSTDAVDITLFDAANNMINLITSIVVPIVSTGTSTEYSGSLAYNSGVLAGVFPDNSNFLTSKVMEVAQ
ncbi:hypothetical protein ACO0K9_00915 [Undibacterium sp. Ji50W]|uniref:hypothetical protein n=1 Tax=Undibacterium sp. Ji50W TaxID=3413041 RepID=UPI003BEF7CEC